jgi:hypothetical protein
MTHPMPLKRSGYYIILSQTFTLINPILCRHRTCVRDMISVNNFKYFPNRINRLYFVTETECVYCAVRN